MNHKNISGKVQLWGPLIVLLAVVGVVMLGIGSIRNSPTGNSTLSTPITAADWSQGKIGSKVVLVEYSDFQCPACGAYYPIVKKLVQEFGDRIQMVYRNFPLSTIHVNAERAARAAESAGLQGKFWEMHDMLFENQTRWATAGNSLDLFTQYALSLGLDKSKFTGDFSSNAVRDAVNSDYESGLKSGVNGTPTFFINGKKIENPNSYDDFKILIQNAVSQTAQ